MSRYGRLVSQLKLFLSAPLFRVYSNISAFHSQVNGSNCASTWTVDMVVADETSERAHEV